MHVENANKALLLLNGIPFVPQITLCMLSYKFCHDLHKITICLTILYIHNMADNE